MASLFIPTSSSGGVPNVEMDTGTGLLTYSTAFSRSAAKPTTGSYTQGDFVWNSTPVISQGQVLVGWSRLTTGSGHVLGVDWAAAYSAVEPNYLSQSTALFARMTVPPDIQRKALINDFIGALITAGVWSKLDCLYVMAAADAQAGGLNWVGTSNTLSPVNSPNFTADRGYQGNGSTSYVDTGFVPGTGQTLQDSNHLSVWSLTEGQNGQSEIGQGSFLLLLRSMTDTFITRSANSSSLNTSNAQGTGFFLISRSASTGYDRYRNGTAFSAGTQASAAFPAYSVFICARNGTGTPLSFSARRLSIASIGGALNSTQQQALYDAAHAYLVGVGAV